MNLPVSSCRISPMRIEFGSFMQNSFFLTILFAQFLGKVAQ